MARSLKKGPDVFERLLNRVQELNKNNKNLTSSNFLPDLLLTPASHSPENIHR